MRDAGVAGLGQGSAPEGHIYPLRVQWEDTDAAGIVYYANYLRFIERARSDILLRQGISQHDLMAADGLAFAVRACTVEYLRPARLHDELVVASDTEAVTGATITLAQSVWRGPEILADTRVTLAYIDARGRPKRLPQRIAALFATLSTNFSQSSGA